MLRQAPVMDTTEKPGALVHRQMKELDWNGLISQIRRRKVIPILGPGLLRVEQEDGGETDVYALIAAEVASARGLELKADARGFQAIDALARASGGGLAVHADIQAAAEEVVKRLVRDKALPEALLLLAAIKDFPLIVSTTFDSLMLHALRQQRPEAGEPVVKVYSPKAVGCDLEPGQPSPDAEAQEAILYQLFGSAEKGGHFVIGENDAINFVYGLHRDDPQRLLGLLDTRRLLLIGCEFPDWFARFFLRLARNGNGSEREIFADPFLLAQGHFPAFLSIYRSQSCFWCEGSPAAFVKELHRRWSESEAAGALPPERPARVSLPRPEPQRGEVFLSYSRTDLMAVKRLKSCLDQEGIATWFDFQAIPHGDPWREEIERGIDHCSLFVPLLSASTLQRMGEAVFVREWNRAIDRAGGMRRKFIVPVFIDENAAAHLDSKLFPKEFKEPDIALLKDGQATPKFIEDLKSTLSSLSSAS